MNEREIYINGLKVNYKIAGEGQPILILHGWGGSSNSWIKVLKILAGEGYQVRVPDFPGFGKNKTPAKPWGVDDYVKWLVDFTNSQNLSNFFLLGHSFGGRIAIRFAVKYPEKLKGLILCASAGIKPKQNFATKIIYLIALIGNVIFTPKFLARFKDAVRNLFYIFLRNRDYVRADGTMKETIKKVLDEDLLEDIPRIKIRTLLIWGEKDKLVPLKYAYMFKEKIKNSELKILPKVGHTPNLEAPEKLAEIILKFLKIL